MAVNHNRSAFTSTLPGLQNICFSDFYEAYYYRDK